MVFSHEWPVGGGCGGWGVNFRYHILSIFFWYTNIHDNWTILMAHTTRSPGKKKKGRRGCDRYVAVSPQIRPWCVMYGMYLRCSIWISFSLRSAWKPGTVTAWRVWGRTRIRFRRRARTWAADPEWRCSLGRTPLRRTCRRLPSSGRFWCRRSGNPRASISGTGSRSCKTSAFNVCCVTLYRHVERVPKTRNRYSIAVETRLSRYARVSFWRRKTLAT